MSMRKHEAVIGKVKSKHFQRTHKHGLWIPKTWKEASETGRENGDSLCKDAVEQEMKTVKFHSRSAMVTLKT